MKTGNARQQGTVMLEALLALVLFALVATALLTVSGQALMQRQQLQRTQCASWAADNLLVMEMLSPSRPVMGTTRGEVQQCDITWGWTLTRKDPGDKRAFLVTLEIHNEKGQSQLTRQILRPW